MATEINMEKILVAHNGSFHADDIFACATILAIFPDEKIKIIRTRDEEIIKSADYVVDVGGIHDEAKERFDHHQKGGAGMRENGIPYASFGLVWQKYGEKLCGSREVADAVDMQLVSAIDAGDNGIELYENLRNDVHAFSLHSMYSLFLPTWKEDFDVDLEFIKLVSYAKSILLRFIKKTTDLIEGEKIVREIYKNTEDKRVIIFDGYMPWKNELLKYPEPLIVLYPRADGNWNIEATLVKRGAFERRVKFPQSWAGLRDEELEKVSGISGGVFCHNGLFLAVTKTREGALALARLALEANKM